MATGSNIRTYFQGRWHEGDLAVIRAADQGAWLGANVFDGARWFDGMAPDLDLHCQRVNRSAKAMELVPTCTPRLTSRGVDAEHQLIQGQPRRQTGGRCDTRSPVRSV